jgi:hypothetical protein
MLNLKTGYLVASAFALGVAAAAGAYVVFAPSSIRTTEEAGLGLAMNGANLDADAVARENDFLQIVPDTPVPEGVEPIEGAENVEFKHCDTQWLPEWKEHRRDREWNDIYGYVKRKNVIDTKDCSCTGKVASWQPVEAIYAELQAKYGVSVVKMIHTDEYFQKAEAMTPVAEAMCGGKF